MEFAHAQKQVGRYYGGPLTPDEVRMLIAGVELKQATLERIEKEHDNVP
jgi:hypothetical protein